MTDRHAGYVVVLARDIREDDAAATIAAIQQIKGVLTVTPVLADAMTSIATARAAMEIRNRLLEGIFAEDKS